MGTQKGQKVPIGDPGPQLGTPLGAVPMEQIFHCAHLVRSSDEKICNRLKRASWIIVSCFRASIHHWPANSCIYFCMLIQTFTWKNTKKHDVTNFLKLQLWLQYKYFFLIHINIQMLVYNFTSYSMWHISNHNTMSICLLGSLLIAFFYWQLIIREKIHPAKILSNLANICWILALISNKC